MVRAAAPWPQWPGRRGQGLHFQGAASRPLRLPLRAVPMAAQHIANGMYGMILVEPEQGLRRSITNITSCRAKSTRSSQSERRASLRKHRQADRRTAGLHGVQWRSRRSCAQAAQSQDWRNRTHLLRRWWSRQGLELPHHRRDFSTPHCRTAHSTHLRSATSRRLPSARGSGRRRVQTAGSGKFFLVDHALSRVEKGLKGTIEVSGEARADLFRPSQPVDSALAASSGIDRVLSL